MMLNDQQAQCLNVTEPVGRPFRVVSSSVAFPGKWLVVRQRDLRVMTHGSVTHCLRWVKVWGVMLP